MPRKPSDSAAIDPLRKFPVSVPPLRPCPFCGGSEVWINSDIDPKFVVCKECLAFGPTAPNVKQAAERWNKRTTPPKTNAAAATSG
jgi:Lar family restriction alleviation protein